MAERQTVRSLLLVVALTLVVMAPVIVAAVAITSPRWHPTGDMAQAELHVRGFWSHPPLVGAAGRIQNAAGVQGSHPGPLLWTAMWPLYALGGSTTAALVASVVVVHVITLLLALWLAQRHGGWSFVLALGVVLALVVRAGGPDVFTEPWNPWMGLLPFLVFLLSCWAFLDGDRWAIILAAAAGTYCVQAHTGYVVVVAGLLTAVVTAVLVRAARAPPEGGRRLAVPLAWTAAAVAVTAVLWIPPLLDQLRREPGNLSILRDNFSDPSESYLAAADVAEAGLVQLNLLGPWVAGPDQQSLGALTIAGFIAFVALWAGAVVAARQRAAVAELRLHAVLLTASILAVVSISRIFGLYFEYTVRWVWLITATAVAASAVSFWRARPWRAMTPRRAVPLATGVLACIVLVAAVQFARRAGPTGAIDSRAVAGLIERVEPHLDANTSYLVRWWDPIALGATGTGLVLELERRGYDAGVEGRFAAAVLPHRVLPEERAGAVLYAVVGERPIEAARQSPGVTELGSFDVRSPSERLRSDELRAQLEEALRTAGREDQLALLDSPDGLPQLLFADPPLPSAVHDLLFEYIELRQPVALFRAAPFTPVLPLAIDAPAPRE